MAFKNDKQRRAAFARMGKDYHSMNPDMAKRAVNALPDTPANRKKWVEDSRRIDIEGLDTPTVKGQSINNNRDNSSLPKKEKAGEKTTMDELLNKQIELNKLQDVHRHDRVEYVTEYNQSGKKNIEKDPKYVELAKRGAELYNEIQEINAQVSSKKSQTLNTDTDFSHQFGNTIDIKNRADYEKLAYNMGITTYTDAEIRKDYALAHAEYQKNEWDNKTRNDRVKQVIGAEYRTILENVDAEKRRLDTATKKSDEEYYERQRKAEKWQHDLDNDVY